MQNIKKIQDALPEELDGVLLLGEADQRYAAGFGFTDGAVLVARTGAWLITDSRYIEAAQNAVTEAEVLLTSAQTPLSRLLLDCVEKAGIKTLGIEEKVISLAEFRRYEELLPCALAPAQHVLERLRASKSPEELETMIRAQRIAEKALDEVLGLIHPGMTERELAAEINYRMMRGGAEGNSFDTISITGSNTSMPHGVPGETVLKKGDFVTMDFGCIKDGYCSDMTRTVALGSVTDEMRKVYDIVYEAQLAGIAAARPGVPGCEIDGAARRVIEKAGYGEYFGHGFGHSLGLEIHEDPRASVSNREPMPVGAVVSAEPGIYLPGRFGVRIEDVMYLGEKETVDITLAPKQLIILDC